MGTKLEPGKYDCYANAKPDEPMMVLLARGDQSPLLTELWAAVKAGDYTAFDQAIDGLEKLLNANRAAAPTGQKASAKITEALTCATNMRAWKRANPEA